MKENAAKRMKEDADGIITMMSVRAEQSIAILDECVDQLNDIVKYFEKTISPAVIGQVKNVNTMTEAVVFLIEDALQTSTEWDEWYQQT